jgi:hypothetical protein
MSKIFILFCRNCTIHISFVSKQKLETHNFMLKKIIWILLGMDALMFLFLLYTAFIARSDAAGKGMMQGFVLLAGIVLVGAALPVLTTQRPGYLYLSAALASLPWLAIGLFWLSRLSSANSQQSISSVDVHFSDPQQRSIAQAIADNNPGLLQELIQGQNLNVSGTHGLNYLDFAIRLANSESDEARKQELIRILIKGGADPNQSLTEAIDYLLPTSVAMFLDAGADPNLHNSSNQPVIFQALSVGKPGTAELLIRKGANPDAVDGAGYSLMMRAAMGNNWPFVRFLLENTQVDCSYITPDGQSLSTIVHTADQKSLEADSTLISSPDFLLVNEWLKKKEQEQKKR